MACAVRFVACVAMLVAAACGTRAAEPADAVYSGGVILTMAGPEPERVESLAVKDGRIVFVGAMASRSFLRAGLPFTFSHDAPVSPVPSILALVDSGVNRMSGSGRVIGPDERITPYQALRAVTVTAAYQLKEEKTKGTLEVGKLADLVILEKNPLAVEPTTIKDIAVVETIKEGKTVWRR